VAVRAETEAGLVYGAVGTVETVAVTAEGVTVALAPGAVAMTVRGSTGASQKPGFRAWRSHSGFSKAMGKAGPGKEWHHIVEQTPGNVQRFGPEALHNTDNVIPLDKGLHTRVSALYSSVRREITGTTLTIRQWLGTQSYAAQRDFGLLAIRNISGGVW
jgi:hypothetical protein